MGEDGEGSRLSSLFHIFHRGAKAAVIDQTGEDLLLDDGSVDTGALRSFLDRGKAKTTELVNDSIDKALQTERIQKIGVGYVRESINETVEGIRQNFEGTLNSVAASLKPETPDNRSTYTKIRDLLHSDDDAWYVAIGKNIGARAIAFGFPILNFVSAKVAARVSGNKNEKSFEGKFKSIYGSLLSHVSPPRQPAATA